MKFAEHLSAHITPEWRKQYIQYEVRYLFILFCACSLLLRTRDCEATKYVPVWAKLKLVIWFEQFIIVNIVQEMKGCLKAYVKLSISKKFIRPKMKQ